MKSTAWQFGALPAIALSTALLLSACAGNGTDGSTAAPAEGTASAAPQASASPEPRPTAESAPTSTPDPAGTGEPAETLPDDFPELLTPAVEESTIEISTVERSDEVAVVSLVAVTSATPEEVLEHYRELLAEQGFEALGPDSIDGTMSQTFSRNSGQETVTIISVVEQAGETTYTLGAHLLASSVE